MVQTVITAAAWLLASAILCPLLGAAIALRERKGR